MNLVKPEDIVRVYIAEYIEIETPKGLIKGNVGQIKERFNTSSQKLHEALKKYFEAGKIKVKFKVDE